MGALESTPLKEYSMAIPNSAEPGYGPVHVSHDSVPLADHKLTLWENFLLGRNVSGDSPYLGTRIRDANGKAGRYSWQTYNEVHDRAARLATGFQTQLGVQRQDMVGVFSKNRADWMIAEIACNRMSYVLVPLYDTLGPKAIPFIVNHSEMRVLICSGDLVPTVLEAKAECPFLQHLVTMDQVTLQQRKDAEEMGIKLTTFQELENSATVIVVESPPLPSDIATICYTSGTTGDPKGAIISHRNLAFGVEILAHHVDGKSYMTHISYLPLAHVFERINVCNITRIGGSIGFYQGDILQLMDDMAELKPHVFVSVPRLFNRVYDKIMQGVETAGGLKKLLFDYAYSVKQQGLVKGSNVHSLWDKLVFAKIREALGGRVEVIVSGSAPLAPNVKEFLKIAFSCRVEEGYGLTETAATATLTQPDLPAGAHIGIPLPNVQIRLADVPDMNYTSADIPRPRGEICIRGGQVFSGYFKDEEKTAEAIVDGWLHTGDIGAWNEDGTISIIDRKKNIFKLSQGEYVAAEKIENIYLKSPFVAQIFLYGDSLQSCLVAVVVPDPDIVQAWATSNKIPEGNNLSKMAARSDLKADIIKSMDIIAHEAKLNGFERAKDISLHHEMFSIENDLITPTFKLKRPQLKAYFQQAIDSMYAGLL